MAAVAGRTMLRSVTATATARSAAARSFAGAKPTSAPSPFRIPVQKPLNARIFRSPVELCSVSVESMFPYHTATASALMTSLLSDCPRVYGWTIEDC